MVDKGKVLTTFETILYCFTLIIKLMTFFRKLLCPLLCLCTALPLYASLEVVWEHPENYTDTDYSYANSRFRQNIVLNDLERFFRKEGERSLPEGLTLTLTVTDVDLAGRFEPWRQHGMDRVRIVKDLYPARIQFRYVLTDSEGSVLLSGEEDLKDHHVGMVIMQGTLRSDTYPYVKQLVRDWLRSLVRDLPPAGVSSDGEE